MITGRAADEFAFDESPCDLCPQFARCKAELLACSAFVTFVRVGARRWAGAPREPSHEIYLQIEESC